MRNGSAGRSPVASSVLATVALAALALTGCAAGDSGSPERPSDTPSATDVAPPDAGSTGAAILDDGSYRAAVYIPTDGTIGGAGELEPDDLEAGTLVDLGDGCLGLENDAGERSLVAFPVGTTLENGRVTAVGMDAFGLDQPLRYTGAMGTTKESAFSLVVPDGCPADLTDVWFFIAASSVGVEAPGDD